jgi:hypothetical protein
VSKRLRVAPSNGIKRLNESQCRIKVGGSVGLLTALKAILTQADAHAAAESMEPDTFFAGASVLAEDRHTPRHPHNKSISSFVSSRH